MLSLSTIPNAPLPVPFHPWAHRVGHLCADAGDLRPAALTHVLG